jgi:MFS family permease
MLTMPVSGKLYDKIGPRMPAIIGLVITAFSTLWLQYMDVTTSFDQFRWVMFIRGMGMGLAMMPIMTYALAAVPQKLTAQASSLMNITRTVFASLGIAIFATLLDGFHKTNLGTMVQIVTPDSMEATKILSAIQVTLMQAGQTFDAARQMAITLLYQVIDQQAYVMAFQTDYFISAVVVFIGLIPALFLPHGRAKHAVTPVDMSI